MLFFIGIIMSVLKVLSAPKISNKYVSIFKTRIHNSLNKLYLLQNMFKYKFDSVFRRVDVTNNFKANYRKQKNK